jgi:hypothetical protein
MEERHKLFGSRGPYGFWSPLSPWPDFTVLFALVHRSAFCERPTSSDSVMRPFASRRMYRASPRGRLARVSRPAFWSTSSSLQCSLRRSSCSRSLPRKSSQRLPSAWAHRIGREPKAVALATIHVTSSNGGHVAGPSRSSVRRDFDFLAPAAATPLANSNRVPGSGTGVVVVAQPNMRPLANTPSCGLLNVE